MARTAQQYQKLLFSLLPKGFFWTRRTDSILGKILYALGEELSRIEGRAEDLLLEQDVRNTTELVTEHEKDYGLPDTGDEISSIIANRREELHSMLLKVGQQFEQYYIDIAAALGYTITIEEFTPAWSGVVTAGNACGDQNNIFYWKILIDLDSVTESIEVNIKKLINKIINTKPAHTHVLFDFTGAGFSRGFSSGFDRIPHYDNSWLNPSFNPAFSNGFENNTDYDGENYIGAYHQGFNIGFDRYSGGGYSDGFTQGFLRQN